MEIQHTMPKTSFLHVLMMVIIKSYSVPGRIKLVL